MQVSQMKRAVSRAQWEQRIVECRNSGVPVKGMATIYAETSNDAESVILGVINESQEAESGETRFYSMDENKVVKSTIYLKKDGTIEYNGNTYSMVRFEPLKTGLQNPPVQPDSGTKEVLVVLLDIGMVSYRVPVTQYLLSQAHLLPSYLFHTHLVVVKSHSM